jgi:hypothetical protein
VPPGDLASPPEVTRCSSVPCRPQTPWCGWVNENAFATILQARPCPTFGRPVHHWVSPSITARYFSSCPSDSILRYSLDGHPALRSTASSGSSSALAVSSFRLRARLDFCLPSAFSGQRGITPACWIWRPSFERQRDLNPPEQRAAQHAVCRCVTPRERTCEPCGLGLRPPTCGLVEPPVSPRSPGSRA